MNSRRLRTVSITPCLFLLILSCSFAQDSTCVRPSLWSLVSKDAKYAVSDASSFLTAPLRFGAEEWLYTAGFLGGTALLATSDEAVQREFSIAGHRSLNGDFWDIPTAYGSTYFACGLTLAAYTTGLITENDELRVTGRLLGESLILSGIPTLLTKYAAGRTRPYAGDGPWSFRGFQWSYEHQSFPSGHATIAFALSTVLAERLDNTWARVGFYGLASLTALARVRNNQHWFSDAAIGAGLGLASGFHVIAKERERGASLSSDQPRVRLQALGNGITLTIRLN